MFSLKYWGGKGDCSCTYHISFGSQIVRICGKAYVVKVKKVKLKKEKTGVSSICSINLYWS